MVDRDNNNNLTLLYCILIETKTYFSNQENLVLYISKFWDGGTLQECMSFCRGKPAVHSNHPIYFQQKYEEIKNTKMKNSTTKRLGTQQQ